MLSRVSSVAETEVADGAQDAESLLTRWRERVLSGALATGLAALVPAWAVQSWQAHHGVAGSAPGQWVVLGCIVAWSALYVWRGPYRVRAALLLALGFAGVAGTLFDDGFSPAQCIVVCLLTTVSALLYSRRVAVWLLAAFMSCMALAAYLFSSGQLQVLHTDQAPPP